MTIANLISTQHPDVNPYRHAVYAILQRLLWDLHSESWLSRRKLKALKNQHIGKKAVIVCNGPSLLKSDLSLLEGTFTFGLNKINLLFEKSIFRPSCIVAVNRLVLEQNLEFYNQTDIPLFLDKSATKFIKSCKNVTFLHSCKQFEFAKDCSFSIGWTPTVTFAAMQLAFHMGFKDVALIGCDHNFTTKGPANQTVTSGKQDENHFDPNYFAGGVQWHLPDLAGSEMVYNLATSSFYDAGRRLVNCTEGGQLELLPRMQLSDFIKD